MTDSRDPHARELLILCVIGLVCFFGAYLRIPVLPLFAASLGATTPQVGLINAAFMLSAGLLAIPAGLLADRLGHRPMLLGGMLVIAGSSLLIPFAPGPLLLALVYLLFGAGLAAFTPTMMSSVADVTPPSQLGRAYSWYTTAVYVGMTFGPAAGGIVARTFGLGRVFFLSAGLIFLSFLVARVYLPKRTPRSHAAEARAVRASLLILLPNRRLVACLIGTVGGCFGFGMFISFLPLHAQARGLDAGHVGMVFAAQALANVLLRVPFGRLSDRIDRGGMAVAGLAFFAGALALTGLCRGFLTLAVCAALIGVGMGVGFTALGALVAEVVPREERGLAMGLYNSSIYLGMTLSSATMGWVIRHAGFGSGFLVAGAFSLLLALWFLWLYRRSPPIPG